MLEISDLTKRLGKRELISNISFLAQRQECIGLLGEQGAGKTTLLNLISGSVKPSSGVINVQGIDIQSHPLKAKQQLGYQLKEALGHQGMSVKGVLDFVAAIRGLRGADKRRRMDQVTARLELQPVLDAPVEVLTTGLQRRVAIAQAILHTPAVLLLDDPADGLEPDQWIKLKALIQSLTDEMTVIVASRQCNELSGLCTRALVIANGRLISDAPMSELQRHSRHFQAVTLAAQTPLDLLALAVVPGVAGIEENKHAPGTVTVLATPGHSIFPSVSALIASRGWDLTTLNLEPGRVNEVVHHLSRELSL
ncbi:ABC transporter ATP-binding protein [Pseudomonas tolaasii]|uniref:ABC transporter ATP-binding protein n=1 Tax=Pseudomonas tolaasii TaxID=29442 RepID=UPI00273401B9|nr:ABC transporter ATP-binding protein [Pseudomonas tolaasii]WLH53594.1 ABC transporter ATP-binding protein [Pseudomonas tolaasii]